MNTPTEPGFYWAHVLGRWQPVEVVTPYARSKKLAVEACGLSNRIRFDFVAEWGERIQREGEQ